MKKNKKLFAGPFVGEFGWELFCWQGYIRYLAKHKFNHTTVACRKGSSFLYEDFADTIIEHEITNYKPDGPLNHGDIGNIPEPPNDTYHYIGPQFRAGPSYNPIQGTFDTRCPQIYHQYNKIDTNIPKIDFLIHARSRKITGTYKSDNRNLPEGKWNQIVEFLLNKGYAVGSIGIAGHAHHIKNTVNLLNLPLSTLCSYLQHSKCLLGPSSGPMHFASLCNSPILVWSGSTYNKMRYETKWNPFNSKVAYLHGWSGIKVQDILSTLDEHFLN